MSSFFLPLLPFVLFILHLLKFIDLLSTHIPGAWGFVPETGILREEIQHLPSRSSSSSWGETDKETHDFWSDKNGLPREEEASATRSKAWSLDRARAFRNQLEQMWQRERRHLRLKWTLETTQVKALNHSPHQSITSVDATPSPLSPRPILGPCPVQPSPPLTMAFCCWFPWFPFDTGLGFGICRANRWMKQKRELFVLAKSGLMQMKMSGFSRFGLQWGFKNLFWTIKGKCKYFPFQLGRKNTHVEATPKKKNPRKTDFWANYWFYRFLWAPVSSSVKLESVV